MDDVIYGEGAELFRAQRHRKKRMFSFFHSMTLKLAVELGIPDIIQKHTRPITLPQLVSALNIAPTKTSSVHRLLRLLVHSGFFAVTKVHEHGEEKGYILTPSSKIFLKNFPTPNLSPCLLLAFHRAFMSPWHFLGDWLRGNDPTAFETAHGMNFWEFGRHNPDFLNLFNEARAIDTQALMSLVRFGELKPVFEGLSSVVDVGGGTGMFARFISEVFPQLKCTVLDFPHVVVNCLPENSNLKYVGGDMFQSVPSADAILLKHILHDWSDEDCVKILKKCREAIPSKEEGGKVIIIEMVINEKKDDAEITEEKLAFDMGMMINFNGKERDEKEWEKLFLESGFRHYKIIPMSGVLSLIEVFP